MCASGAVLHGDLDPFYGCAVPHFENGLGGNATSIYGREDRGMVGITKRHSLGLLH